MNEEIIDAAPTTPVDKAEESKANPITFLSIILSCFPALVILMAIASFIWIFFSPGIFSVLTFLFTIYIFPLLVYRVHNAVYPVKEGVSYLGGKGYSPWWGSHQIQVIYIAFPTLEVVLRLIPGAFSVWLRLWGAKVGKNVYWTPQFEIADRGLIEIGDRVVFGHGVGIYPHIIKPRKENLMLYVKKVKIGSNVFLGAWNHIGPGVSIEEGTYLPVFTHIYPNKKFSQN